MKTIASMMGARTRQLRHVSRTFPKFREGMSTAEYVQMYWGANACNIGLDCGYKQDPYKLADCAIRDFFEPLNTLPATMLQGPEVIAEVLQ